MRRRELVVLCGAGISAAPPAGLPLGGQVIESIRREIVRAWNDAALVRHDFSFLRQMVPERVISALQSVCPDQALGFMDSFFSIKPNVNHLALAALGLDGGMEDIVTVNFDFGIEMVNLPHLGGSLGITESSIEARRVARHRCRVHKIHGTLRQADFGASVRERYSTLQFTIERVGTALNRDLISWLGTVLAHHVVLITGYRGDDLDVLPALQRVPDLRHVIWNFHPELPGESTPTWRWLVNLGDRATVFQARAEDYLPDLLGRRGIKLALPPPSGEGRAMNLGYLHEHRGALLIAAGQLIQEAGPPERGVLLDSLFSHLDSKGLDLDPSFSKEVRIMAVQLRASVRQEAGDRAEATRRFAQVVRLIATEAARDEVALEVTLGQASSRLHFQHASELKRPRPLTLLSALVSLAWLIRLAQKRMPAFTLGSSCVEDVAARKLAAYFVGDILAAWALVGDAVMLPRSAARWLELCAVKWLDLAIAPEDTWVPHQSFHAMRRDEVWLLAHREFAVMMSRPGSGVVGHLKNWDANLAHYLYISEVMNGNVGLQMVLLLKAMRAWVDSASQSIDTSAARYPLDEADGIYAARGYPAGTAKTKLYRWILDNADGKGGLRVRISRLRELALMARRRT